MINTTIKVLDNGFVRLESFVGGDQAVVRSARVSYGSTAGDSEKDQKLIKYMLNHHHGTPFEHSNFTWHVKLPIFVARQWMRHRIGSFNELSARYTEMADEFYTPITWRAQDTKNKQGSVTADLKHERCTDILKLSNVNAVKDYQELLELGVAKEMARFVLPVNLYTQFYWTVNARAMLHFIGLRSDLHAQAETRQYSHAMAWMVRGVMPWTFQAFIDSIPEADKPGYVELHSKLEAYDAVMIPG